MLKKEINIKILKLCFKIIQNINISDFYSSLKFLKGCEDDQFKIFTHNDNLSIKNLNVVLIVTISQFFSI